MQRKNKIIVAMSGGVDSSVAAGLMANEGHEVIGVTLRLLARGATGFGCCGSPEDLTIAKRSAEKVGIPHYVLDYTQDFDKNVIGYFVDSYISGETPNPCVACNRYIKFDRLEKFAKSIDATHLVTGHYARIHEGKLYEAVDSNKDQSYVLYNIAPDALKTTSFPIGHYSKTEIRKLAHDFDLPNADKEDSQEICFVPNRDYGAFVKQEVEKRNETPLTTQPGFIKDISGKKVGDHKGVAFYTVGQRKGLDIKSNDPHYVIRLDAKTNTVVVGPDKSNLSARLVANDLNWIQGTPPENKFEADIKIRYKHEPAKGIVTVKDGEVYVEFNEPQRAVTPGQSAVFYRFDKNFGAREVLGGGKIV